MIWQIAKKDFLHNIISTRFIIGFILCLFLIPFSILINIDEYGERVRLYHLDNANAERRLKEVRVYSRLRPEIVKPPEPLSIFSKGSSSNLGSRVRIWLGDKPMLAEGQATTHDNPLLGAFFSTDFVGILSIIMALLALIFSYDICTGEKEDGTLKLQLSNSLSRAHILMGKICGVLLTLLPILAFCYLLSAVIILLSGNIAFTSHDWSRIILLFFTSLLYLVIFILIGLFISTRSKSSVTSVIVCLFFWVFFVFIIPNLSVYLTQSYIRVESRDNLNAMIQELNDEFREKSNEYAESLDPPDWYMNWYSSGGQDGGEERYGCSKSFFEYHRQNNIYSEPLRIDYADKKWIHQKTYLESQERQHNFANLLSLFSPSALFQGVSSTICHTDYRSHERFMERTRQYRETFIRYFQDKELFSSYVYLTKQPPESFRTADELVRIKTGGEFQTLQQLREWSAKQESWLSFFNKLRTVSIPEENRQDYGYIDGSDIPVFQWQKRQLLTGLHSSILNIGITVFCCILLFYLSFLAFMRYDVR